jgi:serpin B
VKIVNQNQNQKIMKIIAKAAIILAFMGVAATSTSAQNDKVKALAQENNAFAFDLYKQNFAADKNIFLSPYSISSALAMTYGGAVGATANEMQKTLRWSLGNTPDFHKTFGELQKSVDNMNSEKLITRVANRHWPAKGTNLVEEFAENSKKNYGAEIQNLDFSDGLAAAKTINKWVEDNTNNLIKDLLKPADVQGASLVLVNAIYFYGEWAIAFDKKNSRKRSFNSTDGQKKEIDFMHINDWQASTAKTFRYTENDELQILELPYEDAKANMLIILPKKRDGLAQIVKNLSPAQFQKWSSQLTAPEAALNIALPKWKMEYQFSVKNSLTKLGMKIPFLDIADFSAMISNIPVKISDVIHKAFIDVSEKGTEAAAATAVVMVEIESKMPAKKKVINFVADHPFLYFIRDNATGSILFMGHISQAPL